MSDLFLQDNRLGKSHIRQSILSVVSGLGVTDCGVAELLPYQTGRAVHVYTKINTHRGYMPAIPYRQRVYDCKTILQL